MAVMTDHRGDSRRAVLRCARVRKRGTARAGQTAATTNEQARSASAWLVREQSACTYPAPAPGRLRAVAAASASSFCDCFHSFTATSAHGNRGRERQVGGMGSRTTLQPQWASTQRQAATSKRRSRHRERPALTVVVDLRRLRVGAAEPARVAAIVGKREATGAVLGVQACRSDRQREGMRAR